MKQLLIYYFHIDRQSLSQWLLAQVAETRQQGWVWVSG